MSSDLNQRISMIMNDAKKRNPAGFKVPTYNFDDSEEKRFVNPTSGQGFTVCATAINIPEAYRDHSNSDINNELNIDFERDFNDFAN